MANRFRGECSFQGPSIAPGAEDEQLTYTLIYDANAFCEIEEALSTPERQVDLKEILAAVQKGMSMRAFRAVLHGGLSENHPELSVRDAGTLISLMGFEEISKYVGEALSAAMPDDKKKGQSQGNGRKSPGRGAGQKR